MNPNELTPPQALELLAQAAIQFRGTLQEHQSLQDAVRVLNDVVNPSVPDETPTEVKPKAKKK